MIAQVKIRPSETRDVYIEDGLKMLLDGRAWMLSFNIENTLCRMIALPDGTIISSKWDNEEMAFVDMSGRKV